MMGAVPSVKSIEAFKGNGRATSPIAEITTVLNSYLFCQTCLILRTDSQRIVRRAGQRSRRRVGPFCLLVHR
jgi:hypothetical protein